MYKAVLIVGAGHKIKKDIRALYRRKGYLLIGNGKDELSTLDFKDLQNNIGPDTRIDIWSHGSAENGQHKVEDAVTTKTFFTKLAKYSSGQAMHVHLHSCYAGAASPDVSVLPVGSVLVCHSEGKTTLADLNKKTILQSNQDVSTVTAVEDFSRRLLLNMKQTVTLSIKADDGSIFEHTIRLPKHLLYEPSEIIRYFTTERDEFLNKYNEFTAKHRSMPELDSSHMPDLTTQDAMEWRRDNFFYLVATGDKKLLEAINRKKNFSDCINDTLSTGSTALILAAKDGHDEIISALASIQDMNPNLVDKIGWTALMWAAENGQTEAISALASIKDIDPNIVDKEGWTALMFMADYGDYESVRALASIARLDPNIANKEGWTALMYASYNGYVETIRALTSIQGIDPNLVDKDGRTALMHTARQKFFSADISVLLLEAGADVNVVDKDGKTALMCAVKSNEYSNVEQLLKAGAGINVVDKDGKTALDYAREMSTDKLLVAAIAKAKESENAKNPEEAQVVFPPVDLESSVASSNMRNLPQQQAIGQIPASPERPQITKGNTNENAERTNPQNEAPFVPQVVMPDAATQAQLAVALFGLGKKVFSALRGFKMRNFGPIEDKEKVRNTKKELKRKLSEAKKILKTVSDPLNSACNAKRNEVNALYERKSKNKDKNKNKQLEEEYEKVRSEYTAIKDLNDKVFDAQYELEKLEAEVGGLKSNMRTGYLKEITDNIGSLHTASLAVQKSALQYVEQSGTGASLLEPTRATSHSQDTYASRFTQGLSHQERLAAQAKPALPPSGLAH
jgi:ankyrin repeat protein